MSAPDDGTDLSALAGELLERAADEHSRRAAHTLPHPSTGSAKR
jgi:hypothetical protein